MPIQHDNQRPRRARRRDRRRLRGVPDGRNVAWEAQTGPAAKPRPADGVLLRERVEGGLRASEAQLGEETAAVREALRAFAELGRALIGARGYRRGPRRGDRGR